MKPVRGEFPISPEFGGLRAAVSLFMRNLIVLFVHLITTVFRLVRREVCALAAHLGIERLIGTIRRECLDYSLFWTATDLELKLSAFTRLLQQIPRSRCVERSHSDRNDRNPRAQI